MLARLFPPSADNRSWSGPRLALWLLGLLLLLKAAMGTNLTFNAHDVAIRADGIPLDSYPPDAARAVVAINSIWGWGHLMLALAGMVVLARYRSLVPFILLVLLLEQVGRKLILLALPIVKVGTTPGGMINIGLMTVNVIALGLALWQPARSTARRTSSA